MPETTNYITVASEKSKKIALILCALGFIGIGGLHDFYLGRIGAGIIKFCTANWFLVGSIIDIIKIASGSYKDSAGAPVRR